MTAPQAQRVHIRGTLNGTSEVVDIWFDENWNEQGDNEYLAQDIDLKVGKKCKLTIFRVFPDPNATGAMYANLLAGGRTFQTLEVCVYDMLDGVQTPLSGWVLINPEIQDCRVPAKTGTDETASEDILITSSQWAEVAAEDLSQGNRNEPD